MKDYGFQPINEGGIFQTIPYEIAYIYKYDDIGKSRWVTYRGDDYLFYTEVKSSSLFYEYVKLSNCLGENLEALNEASLQPYFKSFANGFVFGYDDYDENVLNTTSIFKTDINSVVYKVFDTICKGASGFNVFDNKEHKGKDNLIITHESWYESGQKTGRYYKAWYFIINNYRYFTEVFRSYAPFISFYKSSIDYWKNEPGGEGHYSSLVQLVNEIEKTPNSSESSNPEHTETFKELLSKENHFNRGMPLKFAVRHFLPLTIPQKNNKHPFLTSDQFKDFIRKAFLFEKIDKIKLKVGPRDKGFIYKRFHLFYTNSIKEQYENTNHCRPAYIRLLTDNFDNYDFEAVAQNFSKPTSAEWKEASQQDWENIVNNE